MPEPIKGLHVDFDTTITKDIQKVIRHLYLYLVPVEHGFSTLTTMKMCWNCDRIQRGEKASQPGSWNITVTISLPMWRFLSNWEGHTCTHTLQHYIHVCASLEIVRATQMPRNSFKQTLCMLRLYMYIDKTFYSPYPSAEGIHVKACTCMLHSGPRVGQSCVAMCKNLEGMEMIVLKYVRCSALYVWEVGLLGRPTSLEWSETQDGPSFAYFSLNNSVLPTLEWSENINKSSMYSYMLRVGQLLGVWHILMIGSKFIQLCMRMHASYWVMLQNLVGTSRGKQIMSDAKSWWYSWSDGLLQCTLYALNVDLHVHMHITINFCDIHVITFKFCTNSVTCILHVWLHSIVWWPCFVWPLDSSKPIFVYMYVYVLVVPCGVYLAHTR